MAFTQGTLTEEFRKRRRALLPDALLPGGTQPVLATHTHPLSGAQLMLARLDKKPYPVQGRYVTGWALPGEEILWYYRNFQTEQQARGFFKECRKSGPPARGDFLYDGQVNQIYEWQRHFQYGSQALSLTQMQTLTHKLSDIFNMNAPTVLYKPQAKKTIHAEAVLAENTIKMYRPHLSMLLHEMAHLVNDQINQDRWAWHGPGFMRTYLSLLSLFPQIAGPKNIEMLATDAGIAIAPAEVVKSCALLKDWLKQQHQTDDPKRIPSLI